MKSEDIPGDRCLDECIGNVSPPRFLIMGEGRCTRISSKEEPAVQVPTEGLSALPKRPVGTSVEEEPARQALGQPLVDEERRRSQEERADVARGSPVAIPESLDDLAPAADLLDLVEQEQDRSSPGRLGASSQPPVRFNPHARSTIYSVNE